MIVVGLTGSIGMGKSTTAAMFAAAGIPVHDADATVHRLYAGAAAPPIERAFPGTTVKGAVDRTLLSQKVLADPSAMERLEAIVHPLVRAAEARFLAACHGAGRPLVCLDIPLLFETGGDRRLDAVVVVTATAAVQRARVLARDGMTEDHFRKILARQMPDADKRRRAHFLVDSGHGFAAARRQVAGIVRALAGMSGKRPSAALRDALSA